MAGEWRCGEGEQMTGVQWAESKDRMDTMQVGQTLQLEHPCTAYTTRKTTRGFGANACQTRVRAYHAAQKDGKKRELWCYMAVLWVVRYA